jgi:outer membrane protein OmpA-like peptidoglycan-associated protein
MKRIPIFAIIAAVVLLVDCASVAPIELTQARKAYHKASIGPAAELVPAKLHEARVALDLAEKSFEDDGASYQTRDLSYLADRKAKMSEALAAAATENATTARANKDYQSAQSEIVKNTKEDLAASEKKTAQTTAQLAASERSSALKSDQIATEQMARKDAEDKTTAAKAGQRAAEERTKKAQEELVKLAAVKEEARGLVITLSGSVLFGSGESALLPEAKTRLNQVVAALMETKGRSLTIEGHTDSQGSPGFNQDLSQRRADVVRIYFISRGYPGDLISAKGMGETTPIADNTNAEGRANNRRVEIVVDRSTGN